MPSLCHIHIGRPIVMCGTSPDKNGKMKERREDHLFAKGEKEAPIYQVGKIGAKYLKMESIDEKGPNRVEAWVLPACVINQDMRVKCLK